MDAISVVLFLNYTFETLFPTHQVNEITLIQILQSLSNYFRDKANLSFQTYLIISFSPPQHTALFLKIQKKFVFDDRIYEGMLENTKDDWTNDDHVARLPGYVCTCLKINDRLKCRAKFSLVVGNPG